ncbi:unnamed protein product [Closterium sp. NIES-54]
MGSFAGHIIPGTLFLLVGLWHLRCSIKNYLAAPQAFVSRLWHPAPLPGHWARLELYIIVVGSFLDMALVELGVGTGFHPIENGGVAPGHLNNFEASVIILRYGRTRYVARRASIQQRAFMMHAPFSQHEPLTLSSQIPSPPSPLSSPAQHAAMLLMFFLLGCALLISETTSRATTCCSSPHCTPLHRFLPSSLPIRRTPISPHPSPPISPIPQSLSIHPHPVSHSLLPLPLGAFHILAALTFFCEGMLFTLHSTAHHGLEPRYHMLLAIAISACVVCALLAAAMPHSFLLDAVGSGAIVLQGLLFWQVKSLTNMYRTVP